MKINDWCENDMQSFNNCYAKTERDDCNEILKDNRENLRLKLRLSSKRLFSCINCTIGLLLRPRPFRISFVYNVIALAEYQFIRPTRAEPKLNSICLCHLFEAQVDKVYQGVKLDLKDTADGNKIYVGPT